MGFEMDESLMQDFLTEASELIDQLDRDLVKLETAPASEQADLCNACFRALHTIKGAAGFLALTTVTEFAHAAEDALNALRKGEVRMSSLVMDALLQSADIVREQVETINAGQPAPHGPADLIQLLHDIADGKATEASDAAGVEGQVEAVAVAVGVGEAAENAALPGRALELPASKLDLIEFMAADLVDVCAQLDEAVDQLNNDATRTDASSIIGELAQQLSRTADFFELDELTQLVNIFSENSPKLGDLQGEHVTHVTARLKAVRHLIEQQADALTQTRILDFEIRTLAERIDAMISGDPALNLDDCGVPELEAVLQADRIIAPTTQTTLGSCSDAETDAALSSLDDANTDTATAPADSLPAERVAPGSPPPAREADTTTAGPGRLVAEQTIRVEVGRLESLLNLVGQLVLNKNRVLAMTRNLRDQDLHQDLMDECTMAASDLDRLTSELQIGVMRTRMQPLAKLFERYPRVIRDIARSTNKQIQLHIEGKETEVDKSVLELLADPLVHILRNSADHGIESPQTRAENGKQQTGNIRLVAEHQGSHVRVAIIDDGKGLSREVIGNKAVERGLCTAEQLATMSDNDVFRYIFEAGFSTAAQVSDLSGRGVGMDVVRTNIGRLNGTVEIESTLGKGTTIEILIPLTVAIMPAMVVRVGKHLYSIPLQSIVEIVRPEEHGVHLVGQQPVIRLRDSVLPLLDMPKVLGEPADDKSVRFAVVIQVGAQRVGLCVDRLIGQQEIVIKPLDDTYTKSGPFSGATIREDGEVSLIIDVIAVMRHAPSQLAQHNAHENA